jgi:hypothetical protein
MSELAQPGIDGAPPAPSARRLLAWLRFASRPASPVRPVWPVWPRILGWMCWFGIAAAVAARFAGRAGDDIYITYRYAYNLAHGRGLVFNPGERVFGVSDPGIAVLLAGLHRATGLPIPVLGTLVTAAAMLAIAGLLLAAATAAGRAVEGWIGGTLLLGSAYVWIGQGAGPVPALALLLAAARAADRPRPWLAGLLAGLAFCCRPDAAVGAAALALLLVAEAWRSMAPPPAAGEPLASHLPPPLTSRLTRPLAFCAAFGAVVLAAVGGAWAWFGAPLPETLAAKRHFAALAPQVFTGLGFWRPAHDLFCRFAGGWPGGEALLVLGIGGQVPLFAGAGRSGRLLVLHAAALAVFYTFARLPFFIWYTIPAAVAVLYGAPFLAGDVVRRLGGLASADRRAAAGRAELALAAAGNADGAEAERVIAAVKTAAADQVTSARKGDDGRVAAAGSFTSAGKAAAAGVVAIAGAGVFLAAMAGGVRWFREDAADWRLFAYRRAGEWIRDHTAPQADVVFDEVGIVGYYSDRTIEDLIGLVTPRSRPFAAAGDPVGAFLARPADLVLFHTYNRRGGTRPIVIRPWFAAAYQEIATIPDPAAHAAMLIYGRRPGSFLPPPRPPWHRPPAAALVPGAGH